MANPSDASDTGAFVKRVLIVLALVSLFFLAWHLRTLIVMLFGSVVVAAVFRAIANPIHRHTPLSLRASVTVAILIVLGVLAALVWLFGSEIERQVETLSETIPSAVESLQKVLADWGVRDDLMGLLGLSEPGGNGIIASAARFVVSLGAGIADTMVVIFGGIFLALQPMLYRTGAIKLVPEQKRALVADAMVHSERALGLWLKAQLISMTIIGLLTGLGLWLLGIESALVLGLLAFALEFIPFAGPIIASIPAILVALATSPTLALWVVGLYILVQQLEGNVVYPLVQQWAVHVPAVVLLFSLIGFGMLFGVIGVIFAAPLTVVAYVLVKRLYVQEALHTPTPIPGDDE
jgi:predicted PurR-regulated permease PerM